MFDAWWRAWYNEKLSDYVVRPPKWFRSDPNLRIEDVVIFQKKGSKHLGSPIWTVGWIVTADPSTVDGRVRDVVIEHRNTGEKCCRTTHRLQDLLPYCIRRMTWT